MGGTALTSGTSWVTSWRCPPVTSAASGTPVASVITWCLLPGWPRLTGLGPVLAPPFERVDMAGVDQRPVQVEQPGGVALGEQRLVQLLPDPGLGPAPQPPPAGHAGHPEQGGGQLPPGHVVAQHPQNPLQRRPVVDR